MTHATASPLRLGVVSFLNARPLIEGVVNDPGFSLIFDVPAALPALLDRGQVDAALVPIVDYHRRRDQLRIISDACIASDGETLTVRVFSQAPPHLVTQLRADPDSHTSVMLARILWRELFNRELLVTPLLREHSALSTQHSGLTSDAVLLIGDKVVTDRPRGYGFEIDLGAAWKYATGLPMVFAVWVCPNSLARDRVERLSVALAASRDLGVSRAAQIAERDATAHGWPPQLARYYLSEAIWYRLDDRARAGMLRFLGMAEPLLR